MDNWIKVTGEVLHGADYFPALRAGGRRPGAGVQELADRRQREHAAHVPAGDHRRRSARSTSSSAYFVPDELDARGAGRRAPKRGVRGADHRARASTSTRRSVRRASRARGATLLARRRRDLRVPADDVPLQGDDRRRPAGLGRLDELRQPLVPAQRRGQPQRLRRRRSRDAGGDLRGRSRAIEGVTLAEWAARAWWRRLSEWASSTVEAQL